MNTTSLVYCIECGQTISSKARQCPNPTRKTKVPHGVRCCICNKPEKFSKAVEKTKFGYHDVTYYYHKSCLDQILLSDYTCPVCHKRKTININDYEDCDSCGQPVSVQTIATCKYCYQPILKGKEEHFPDDSSNSSSPIKKIEDEFYHRICLDANKPNWRLEKEERRKQAQEQERLYREEVATEKEKERRKERSIRCVAFLGLAIAIVPMLVFLIFMFKTNFFGGNFLSWFLALSALWGSYMIVTVLVSTYLHNTSKDE